MTSLWVFNRSIHTAQTARCLMFGNIWLYTQISGATCSCVNAVTTNLTTNAIATN